MEEDISGRRQKILTGVAVGIFVIAGLVAWYISGGKSVSRRSTDRMFICSETGKTFEYVLRSGDIEPVYCPHTKKNTGYQAEACYWTKGADGDWKAKADPTWVLVKRRVDPETEEKTYCPDCGRVVVLHNPPPPQEMLDEARKAAGE